MKLSSLRAFWSWLSGRRKVKSGNMTHLAGPLWVVPLLDQSSNDDPTIRQDWQPLPDDRSPHHD